MATVVRSANPFRTLAKHRNFRLFWFGQTISLVGTWMQQVATGWLALELTNSAYMVGLVAAVVIASLGLSWCFGFNALSYLAVLIGLALIRLPARDPLAHGISRPTAIASMRDQLHLDVSGYGLLMTCYGVGATLGALAIASQGGKLPRGATLTVSSLG